MGWVVVYDTDAGAHARRAPHSVAEAVGWGCLFVYEAPHRPEPCVSLNEIASVTYTGARRVYMGQQAHAFAHALLDTSALALSLQSFVEQNVASYGSRTTILPATQEELDAIHAVRDLAEVT